MVEGQKTHQFKRLVSTHGSVEQRARSFSIVYTDTSTNELYLDVMAPSKQDYDYVVGAMNALIESHRSSASAASSSASDKAGSEMLNSTLKIQRLSRRFLARMSSRAEQQWKIFSDLDSMEEKECLELARFMHILLDKLPAALEAKKAGERVGQEAGAEGTGGEVSTPSSSNVATGESITPGRVMVSSNEAAVRGARRVVNGRASYLHTGKRVSGKAHEIAAEIIEVCRLGRKVGRELVVTLIEGCCEILEGTPNTTEIHVPTEGKVTVVGDIHGQVLDLLHIIDESGERRWEGESEKG